MSHLSQATSAAAADAEFWSSLSQPVNGQPASALVSLAIQILAVKGVGVGNRDEALCPPQTRSCSLWSNSCAYSAPRPNERSRGAGARADRLVSLAIQS